MRSAPVPSRWGLPEQIDPQASAFLGNYPQAFSHVGLISSGVNLARLTPKR